MVFSLFSVLLTSCQVQNKTSLDSEKDTITKGSDTEITKLGEEEISLDDLDFYSIEYMHIKQLFKNQDKNFTTIGEHPEGTRAKIRKIGELRTGERIYEFMFYEPKTDKPYLSGVRLDKCRYDSKQPQFARSTRVRFLSLFDSRNQPLEYDENSGTFYYKNQDGHQLNTYKSPIWKQPANDMLAVYLCSKDPRNIKTIRPGMRIENAIRTLNHRWKNHRIEVASSLNLNVDGKKYQAVCRNDSNQCWLEFKRNQMPFSINIKTDGFVVIETATEYDPPFNSCKFSLEYNSLHLSHLSTEENLEDCKVFPIKSYDKKLEISDIIDIITDYSHRYSRDERPNKRLGQYYFEDAFLFIDTRDFYARTIYIHPNVSLTHNEAMNIIKTYLNENNRYHDHSYKHSNINNYDKKIGQQKIIYTYYNYISIDNINQASVEHKIILELDNSGRVDSITFQMTGLVT
ncbi:hypothetical protein [Parathermosynechococcus lividus]